ncbi:MAG: endonuclease/exonuclease/phosphatase family protein [Aggregatilineales bacterium]
MADASASTTPPSTLRQIWRIIRHVLLLIPLTYGTVTFIFLAIWMLSGEQAWWGVNLFVTLMPGTLLFVLITLPMAILLWGRTAILLNLPVFIILIVIYGVRLLPVDLPDAEADFSVMTFNIQATNENLGELWTLVQDADADIVGFQEITPRAAEYIKRVSSEAYPYEVANDDNCSSGRGLISRYPITSECVRADRPFRYQRIVIDIEGREVVFYNVHMPPPEFDSSGFYNEDRPEIVQELLARAAEETAPVILMGDFNMGDMTTDYFIMTSRYTDAFMESGEGHGMTYPFSGVAYGEDPDLLSIPRFVRLDYVFHSDELQSVYTESPAQWRSDHLPLKVDFAWSE